MSRERGARLPREFFARDARVVARALLGKLLVHVDGGVRRAARIVETEAYHGVRDRASHARFGPTPRARVMFGPPGVAYVYLIYGTSHCMNVVTGREGLPSAVLIRAGEPLDGCLHSTRGPGNLCRALAIRREADDGRDLEAGVLFVEDGPRPAERILRTPRVNVHYAGPWAEKPWRFVLEGSPWATRPPRTAFAPGGGPATRGRAETRGALVAGREPSGASASRLQRSRGGSLTAPPAGRGGTPR